MGQLFLDTQSQTLDNLGLMKCVWILTQKMARVEGDSSHRKELENRFEK